MSYNKSTGLSEDTIISTAYCEFINTNGFDFEGSISEPITSIKIYHDETLIYDLSDVTGHIEAINEYFNGEKMIMNMNIRFEIE